MERVKKIGNDGKEHFYWVYTEDELTKLKEWDDLESKLLSGQQIDIEQVDTIIPSTLNDEKVTI